MNSDSRPGDDTAVGAASSRGRGLLAGALVGLGALGVTWCVTTEAVEPTQTAVSAESGALHRQGAPRRAGARPNTRRAAPAVPTVEGVGRVRATIVDDDGQPIGGGAVTLRCLMADGVVAAIAGGAMRVDDAGVFEGPGCPGTVCAEYRHAAYVATQPWSLQSGADTTLNVVGRSRLWGEVVDAAGDPVGAATVVFLVPDGGGDAVPLRTARTSTDAEGTFSAARRQASPCDRCLEALQQCSPPEGGGASTVVVAVRATGHGPTRVELDLEGDVGTGPDTPLTITVGDPAEPIRGRVHDAAGDPLPRAFVLARAHDDPSDQHRADAGTGTFALEGLGDTTYDLRAIHDGIEVATAADVQPGASVTLSDASRGAARALEVEIVSAGQAVVDAVVQGGPFSRASTDSSGQVRVERVLPGTYMLRIRATEAQSGRAPVTVEPTPTPDAPAQHVVVDLATLKTR